MATSTSLPVTADVSARFATVIGAGRGATGPPNATALASILQDEGLAAALRTFGRSRAQLRRHPPLAALLCQHVLDASYEQQQPRLQTWLRLIGVRPESMLHYASARAENAAVATVHFYPTGHLFSDTEERMRKTSYDAACGASGQICMLFNRGFWPKLNGPPATRTACRVCEICSELGAGHYEAQPRDGTDLLPAPALDWALAAWRDGGSTLIVDALSSGANETALLELLRPGLEEVVVSWAARMFHRYPRPNILRALAGADSSDDAEWARRHTDVLVAAALPEEKWVTLLDAHLHTHPRGYAARAWSKTLLQVSARA